MRQHHVVRLVCGGEDTADGASADMNGMEELGRMSFSPGGAAPARGRWGGNQDWGTVVVLPPQAGTAKGHSRAVAPLPPCPPPWWLNS